MKLLSILILILTLFISNSYSENNLEFENWKKTFKAVALKNNISENTFNLVMSDVKFLPKVIEYDRYQPEFYEDTKTYISKRSSDKKVKKGVIFYKDQSELINNVEKKVLMEMLSSPGKTFSREEIAKISGINQERSIDVMITRLRQKIEANPKNPKFLQTIRGSGYVLWIE